MAKVQSRRCVSLSKKVYVIIHEASDRLGRPMSQLVEEIIVATYASKAKPEAKAKVVAPEKPEAKVVTPEAKVVAPEAKIVVPETKPETKTTKVAKVKEPEPKTTKWNAGSKFIPYKRPPGNVMGL